MQEDLRYITETLQSAYSADRYQVEDSDRLDHMVKVWDTGVSEYRNAGVREMVSLLYTVEDLERMAQ